MADLTSLGLGKTMEKKLHSVSIHSADKLEGTLRNNAVKNGKILDMKMYSLLKE